MAKRTNGGVALRDWREVAGLSRLAFGAEVGDEGGEQIRKFEAGARSSLPIPLAARVADRTGLSLEVLLTAEQFMVARRIFALLARDAAA